MRTIRHEFDFCVVGGGIAGLCAALAAARHGARTVLVQDRPVLGGNASSEVRMWLCGAEGAENRETGIVEELELANLHLNPEASFSIWDAVLYGKARYQENLTLLLNTTCTRAVREGDRLVSVKAWEMNAETWHEIHAALFSDCSGDSVLAPLAGADFRLGREAAAEFGEDIAPAQADTHTMGSSCLIQARELDRPVPFTAPDWARHYRSFDEFPNRGSLLPAPMQNYWWIETGGMDDCIHGAARHRDELLRVCFGIWELLKNHPDTRERMRNWELEWVGFLPGKRESRRYVGDHILTQNDVRGGGRFEDIVAYGGWSMDDHHPAGLLHPGPPTIQHPAPSPYGIPYRCLYSRNIRNLFCAGRNVSVTHTALSSTRVMKTCGTMGQAVGTAAALAAEFHTDPRGVLLNHLDKLQQRLLADDVHLPGLRYRVAPLVREARLESSNGADPEGLRSGVDRAAGGIDRSWRGRTGDRVEYTWDGPRPVRSVRLVFDTDFAHRRHNVIANRPLDFKPFHLPVTLLRDGLLRFRDADGAWQDLHRIRDNHDRLLALRRDLTCTGLQLVVQDTWGAPEAGLFAFDFA